MILRIDQLRLSRGSREILRGVNFAADRGELIALMGLSGGGKTTILRAVAALEAFDSGAIEVEGVALAARAATPRSQLRELRRRVGMVFQMHYLFEHLSAIENITLAPLHVAPVARGDAEASCSNRSESRIAAMRFRANFRAAKRSASRSPAPWPWIRRCF